MRKEEIYLTYEASLILTPHAMNHQSLRINLAIAQAMLSIEAASKPEGQATYEDSEGNKRSHWYDALGRFVGGPSSPEESAEVGDKQLARLGESFNLVDRFSDFGDDLKTSAMEAAFSLLANSDQKEQRENWAKLESGKFTEEDYKTKEGLSSMKEHYELLLREEQEWEEKWKEREGEDSLNNTQKAKSMSDTFRDTLLKDTVSTFLNPKKLLQKGAEGIGKGISDAISSVAKMTQDVNVGDMAYLAGFALITAGTMALGGYVAAAGITGLAAIAGGQMAATGASIGVNALRTVVGGAVVTMHAKSIPEYAKAFKLHASKEEWETKQALWDTLDLQLRDSFLPFIEDPTREARGRSGKGFSTINSKSSAREITDGLSGVLTEEKINGFLRLDDPPDDLPEEEKEQMLKERFDIGADVAMYFALLVMQADGDANIDASPRGSHRRKQMEELAKKIGDYYGKLGREVDDKSMIQELKKHGKMPNGNSYRQAVTSSHEANLKRLTEGRKKKEIIIKYNKQLAKISDEIKKMSNLANMSTGREEAIAYGSIDKLEAMLREIESDTDAIQVRDIKHKLEDAREDLNDFKYSVNQRTKTKKERMSKGKY